MILKEAYNSCEKVFGQIKDAYLYGSYARGDYRDDSDMNILITIDLTEEEISDHQWDVAHLSGNLSLKHDIAVNINIKSLDQFEKQYSLTPLYQEILKEGIKYQRLSSSQAILAAYPLRARSKRTGSFPR